MFMDRTSFVPAVKHAACAAITLGVLCQSGGFFVRLITNDAALGTTVTVVGAMLLACAVAVLVYGLITVPRGARQ
jgi:hypothetical protein